MSIVPFVSLHCCPLVVKESSVTYSKLQLTELCEKRLTTSVT